MSTSSYKLFVDDMRPIPAGWIGARTVSEAIAILATLPIAEISLDHDILAHPAVGDLYQALSHETFKGVAYFISQMVDPPVVSIHTANAGAAYTMCQILGLDFNEAYKKYSPDNY